MSDRLDSAIAAFYADESGPTRLELLNALTQSELLFPAAERSEANSPLRLGFTLDSSGRPMLPAFTDLAFLNAWLPAGAYARASGDAIGQTLLSGPFVALLINPGSDRSVRVDRRALEMLLGGGGPHLPDIGEPLVQRWQ